MRIEFTGRQMQVTPGMREYTEAHLRKINRLLGDRFELHVILTAERHRRIAELTLKFGHCILVGVEETADPHTAINGALDKLERQVVRWLGRRRERKRRPKPSTSIRLNVLTTQTVDHEERRILQTERIAIKPMTMADAIDTLDMKGSGVIVFRNAETERVNVIYQRPDGNLGLIEPEP